MSVTKDQAEAMQARVHALAAKRIESPPKRPAPKTGGNARAGRESGGGKAKNQPEYAIQAAFVREMAYRHPNIMVFSDTAAHIKKTMFQQVRANKLQSQLSKNWPDVFVAQPSGDYAGLFLEFKAQSPYLKDGVTLKKNPHNEAQEMTMYRLMTNGYRCAFVWTVEMAMHKVEAYLNRAYKK